MAAVKKSGKKEEVQISLLPDQNGKRGVEARIRMVLIGIFALLIISIAVSSLLLRFRAAKYQEESARLGQSIKEMRTALIAETQSAREVGNLGQRASLAKSLLQNHVAGEKALLFLEASTIPEVTIKQLAFDAEGSLVLSGRGKQFSSLTRQLQSWKEYPRVKDVTMSGISVAIDRIGNIEGIDFTSTITLDPRLLRVEL